KQVLKTHRGLHRAPSMIIIQMRTEKIGLQNYLYQLGVSDAPDRDCHWEIHPDSAAFTPGLPPLQGPSRAIPRETRWRTRRRREPEDNFEHALARNPCSQIHVANQAPLNAHTRWPYERWSLIRSHVILYQYIRGT